MSDSIYLSSFDIARIAHHAHWIPMSRGITRAFMEANFPGWSFNDIVPRLRREGLFRTQRQSHHRGRLVDKVIGVEVDRGCRITPDDGSLRSPARSASWRRADGARISEHLMLSTMWPQPVIIHLPHSSPLIPRLDRPRLELSDSALIQEARRRATHGVDLLARRVYRNELRLTIASAALSPLLFDPLQQRSNSTSPAAAYGAIPLRTSTGAVVRSSLDPTEADWLLEQHRQYEASMQHLISVTANAHPRVALINVHTLDQSDQHDIRIVVDPTTTPSTLVDLLRSLLGRFDLIVDESPSGVYRPVDIDTGPHTVGAIGLHIRRGVLATSTGRAQLAVALGRMTSQFVR